MYLGGFPLYVNLKWGLVGALSDPGPPGNLVTAQNTWGKVHLPSGLEVSGSRA